MYIKELEIKEQYKLYKAIKQALIINDTYSYNEIKTALNSKLNDISDILIDTLFYCIESEKILSMQDIDSIRMISVINGNSFMIDTLENYINCCLLENNGSLIRL